MSQEELIGMDATAPMHRTIDRVTKILEQVVYNPGMTFTELVRALDAPRSSVHGFIRGLLAKGWLFEDDHRFYLGPAVYGLTLASGQIRAGLVTESDLGELHAETGFTVFLGVRAGDNLIYVAEAGSDTLTGFGARTDIRRTLLHTAGGKALLAAMSESERNAYLRRRPAGDSESVEMFLSEIGEIKETGIARNVLYNGTRIGLATTLSDSSGRTLAEVTLVGDAKEISPREEEMRQTLLRFVGLWQTRAGGSTRNAL